MVDKFNQPINGIQRLFFYYDYKILDNTIHQTVSSRRDELKEIWTNTPFPIVKIEYQSSRLGGKNNFYLVYPVCIYYHQRSFYLIAFGQFPQQNTNQSNWYNYRLDRIKSIQELDKNNTNIPHDIKDKSEEDQETLIYSIQDSLEEAYGFDFYLEQDTMLLRFPSEFHKNYISNTVRHRTFQKIDDKKALAMVEKMSLSEKRKEQLIKDQLKAQIESHSDDGYYTLKYRRGDNTVIMRLRAWCPNVEVLLPWDLRQRMKKDMQETWKLYENDPE
jgi:CRISPR-associated protein (TIGR03985 family)